MLDLSAFSVRQTAPIKISHAGEKNRRGFVVYGDSAAIEPFRHLLIAVLGDGEMLSEEKVFLFSLAILSKMV